MAKQIELLDYYDSQRAMFRELYTYENNRFKHAIGRCEYWDSKMFSDLHSELYKGIYENCGNLLKGDHIIDEIRYYRRLPSSVTVADYMGALELKLNAEAMFIASNRMFDAIKSGHKSYNYLLSICYEAGRKAGQNMRYVRKNICPNDFNTPAGKIKNASTLVKKYDKNLKLGHIPSEIKLNTPFSNRYDNLELVRNSAIASYKEFVSELTRLGIKNSQEIKNIMGYLNQGYYQTSVCAFKEVDVEAYKASIDFKFTRATESQRNKMLKRDIKEARYYPENRVTKVIDPFRFLCKKDYYDYLTEEEIRCISDKYCFAMLSLRDKQNINYSDIVKCVYNAGIKAREVLLSNSGILPEMLGGFFLCYSDIQKIIIAEKELENELTKSSSQPKNNKQIDNWRDDEKFLL